MAKQLSYTSDQGVDFPTSYWKITQVVIDTFNRMLRIQYSGFKDAAACAAGKAAIGSTTFDLTEADFVQFWTEVITNKEENAVAWAYAKSSAIQNVTKRTVAENGDVTITKESFFKDASDV